MKALSCNLKTLVFISSVIASCQTREHLQIVNKWVMNMDLGIKYKIEFSNLILEKMGECFKSI